MSLFKKVYKVRKKLIDKRHDVEGELNHLNSQIESLKYFCPHDIIFAFGDKGNNKIGPISWCICPACNKLEIIHIEHKLEETPFNNSRLIDLDEIDYCNEHPSDIVRTTLFDDYEEITKKTNEEIKKIMLDKIKGRQKRI